MCRAGYARHACRTMALPVPLAKMLNCRTRPVSCAAAPGVWNAEHAAVTLPAHCYTLRSPRTLPTAPSLSPERRSTAFHYYRKSLSAPGVPPDDRGVRAHPQAHPPRAHPLPAAPYSKTLYFVFVRAIHGSEFQPKKTTQEFLSGQVRAGRGNTPEKSLNVAVEPELLYTDRKWIQTPPPTS